VIYNRLELVISNTPCRTSYWYMYSCLSDTDGICKGMATPVNGSPVPSAKPVMTLAHHFQARVYPSIRLFMVILFHGGSFRIPEGTPICAYFNHICGHKRYIVS